MTADFIALINITLGFGKCFPLFKPCFSIQRHLNKMIFSRSDWEGALEPCYTGL